MVALDDGDHHLGERDDAPVHDRMPVILPKSLWAEWLDPDNHDTDRLGQLLLPAGDDVLTVHPVGNDVNNVRNKGPELIEPARGAESRHGLTPTTLDPAGGAQLRP